MISFSRPHYSLLSSAADNIYRSNPREFRSVKSAANGHYYKEEKWMGKLSSFLSIPSPGPPKAPLDSKYFKAQ
jgi:hypothetical protein